MKKYKPTTPSRRKATISDYSGLDKKRPEKKLTIRLKTRAGKNSAGRITTRHKGGGVKKLYRLVDFKRNKLDVSANVVALEYDPYRTAFIALLEYEDGQKSYIIAPQGLKVGDKVIAAEKADLALGNRMKLKNIPAGTTVYNIEIQRDRGGKIVRSAGTGARILVHEGKYAHLVMPSKEVRKISLECFASIGTVSNPEHRFVRLGKAGRARRKGHRPTVRGSAMVPADHPHGGGEGRTGIGMKHPKTPWGKTAHGVKTRRRKMTNKFIIQRRKKKKKK